MPRPTSIYVQSSPPKGFMLHSNDLIYLEPHHGRSKALPMLAHVVKLEGSNLDADE